MPATTLNDFAFFALVNSYLKQQIDAFQSGFVERMTQWALAISLVLVTLWLLIQGFRIVTGQSREPMMALVVNGAKISLIVAAATTMGLFGNNLQTFFSESLAGEINYQVSGSSNSAADDIDKNLVYTQLAMAAIDVVQTAPGDTETSNKKARAELLAGLGVAGPPMVAGAMLLFYQFILAAFIGLGPLFILFLIFDQTKQLFHKWLLLGIGTLFSMAMLNVVSSIVLKLTLSVASALWASNAINNMTGFGAEGLSNQALEQGGVGLLMTLLIVSIPPVLGNFFASAAGTFLAYSQVGGNPKGAGGVGPQGQPPESYAPTNATPGQASAGNQRGGDARTNLNLGRMSGNSDSPMTNTTNIPKRDFDS